jgi:broad specificity phosphatase PhoE
MTEIVLARHGETESNRLGVFRGRLDVPLNAAGRAQADGLAAALSSEPLAAVYSSPLRRAWETAVAVAVPHGLSPVADEAFNNIDLGAWQGMEKARIEREQPDLWRRWTTDPERLRLPGGETLASVRERSRGRALELVAAHEGGRFAVVTHRSVIKVLAGALLGLESPFWKLYLDNAAYCVIERRNGSCVLTKWNESCHVAQRVVERF